eukprot:m.190935 g.190935  ORF g.190935 m.190935 type:complete len:504 (+) comp39439_c2_seq3:210-1721(+)
MGYASERKFAFLLAVFEIVFIVLLGVFAKYRSRSVQTPYESGRAGSQGNDTTLRFKLQPKPKTPNDLEHYYPYFQDVHVMMFIGFGFLMTFLKRHGFSSLGFNFLVGAFVIQWATLVNGFFALAPDGFKKDLEIDVTTLVEADFAAAAVMITFGAVLGKITAGQLIFIAFFEVIFYGISFMVGVHYLKVVDAGGSIFIHTFGAYFGLAVAFVLDKKQAREGNTKEGTIYHSDLFAMIGTIFLWMFWPSFNGGLLTAGAGSARHRAIVNTYYSLSASVFAAFLVSQLVNKKAKFEMVHVQNATLAGGVAIGNMADLMVEPWGAALVGVVAGTVSVLGYAFLQPAITKWKIHDTCGVHNLHGIPGIIGAIGAMVAIASIDDMRYGESLWEMFAARAPTNASDPELVRLQALGWDVVAGDGRSRSTQALFQLAALASTLGLAIFGGLLTGCLALIPCLDSIDDEDDLFEDSQSWIVPDELTINIERGEKSVVRINEGPQAYYEAAV